MAAKKKKVARKGSTSSRGKKRITEVALRDFLRKEAGNLLQDDNITSVGVGLKNDFLDSKTPEAERVLCIQFSVRKKVPEGMLESLGTALIPPTIRVNGVDVPTDVVEREYRPSYQIVGESMKDTRKQRVSPLVPGISVGHPKITAGTLGAVVYDKSGKLCMLSNWHVLQGAEGEIGDSVVQPGSFDDNRVTENEVGKLLRSHLGLAGDCAIASIEERGADPKVYELGVPIRRIGRPEIRDRVVKSGRTTEVTYGIVRRVDVTTKLNYEGQGQVLVGGFEIGPDPEHPSPNGEVSMGGDSGSAWLPLKKDGKPDDVIVGLHFAGEGGNDPDEHALACYAYAVFEKLEISLTPPSGEVDGHVQAQGVGYAENFLGTRLRLPALGSHRDDTVFLEGGSLLHYTHFSVAQSKSRKLPRVVGWNIDGGKKRSLSRSGLKFRRDQRVLAKYQAGDELYAGNKLDRGHIARRADLVWGTLPEAKRANSDSFYFTNIAPQHQAFNQSERHGLWGRLENAILEEADVENLRVSVMGGPIFKETDQVYRGVAIPTDFWKVIAFVDTTDARLKAKAYVLTQDDLMNDIEALELDEFRIWQVSIEELGSRTGLYFGDLMEHDSLVLPESAGSRGRAVREVTSALEVV